MPRPLRFSPPNSVHHVINRGNDRQCLFATPDYFEEFLDLVAWAKRVSPIRIIAYCLMHDHLHALLKDLADDADFRRCVSMYKQRSSFAYRKRGCGSLWQEGYFKRVLRPDEDVIGVAAYIVTNPVRAGLCQSPTEYPYLGSPAYSLESLIDVVQVRPNSRP